jgi:hypothetical protein
MSSLRRVRVCTILLAALPGFFALAGCGGSGGGGSGGGSSGSDQRSGSPPSGLSYRSPITFVQGIPATAQWPTVTGSVDSYTVAPSLPAGLSLDGNNGAISGTPTGVVPWAVYSITARNGFGSTTFDLSLAVTGPSADGLAPTIPSTVTVEIGSPVELDVAWQPSTDNVAVTGYHVYRDGVLVSTVTTLQLVDAGLTTGVQHCYTVSAFDVWRNESPQSARACGTPAHRSPVAVLSGPMSVLTGVPATFDASQSHGLDGSIVSYRFDFGDGSPSMVQPSAVASHAYAALGTFTVTLTVSDDAAAAGTASAPLTAGLVLGMPVDVSNTPGLSQTPSAFRETDGSVDVVWEEGRWDILFARSADGGRTFTAPKYVIDPAGPWGSQNSYAAREMQVVAAGGVIHVTLSLFDQLFGGGEIFYANSTDGGATFSAPLMVSTPDDYSSYIPSIAADGDGTVFIAWADDDLAGGPLIGLRYARSVDDGASFGMPAMLVANPDTSCPSVAGSSASIDIAWPQGPIGAGELLFARSTDGAQTFAPPLPLDQIAEHVWCPKLARDASGVIYAAWQEDASPDAGRILFATSIDDGATFSAPIALSSPSASAIAPALAVGAGGRVYVTWAEGIPGPGVAYLAFSSDNGRTFSPALRIDSSVLGLGSFTQVLAVDDTHLALVTNAQATAGGQADIFYVGAQISVP